MTRYSTKQRKSLLDYLQQHADEQMTARQIVSALSEDEISPSAVYRNLSALEDAGQIRRVTRPGTRDALYQYAAAAHCRDCLHLTCRKCGKTSHMDSAEAERLIDSVAVCDSFAIDRASTVIYGVCKDCQKEEKP